MRSKSYNVGAVIGQIVWFLIYLYLGKENYSHGDGKRKGKIGKDEPFRINKKG